MSLDRFGVALPSPPPTIRVFPQRDRAMSEQTFTADDVTNKPVKGAADLPESITYDADDLTAGAIKNAPELPESTTYHFDGIEPEKSKNKAEGEGKVVKSATSESKTVKKGR